MSKDEAPYNDPGFEKLHEYFSAFNGDDEGVFKAFNDEETSSYYARTAAKIAAELLDQVKKRIFVYEQTCFYFYFLNLIYNFVQLYF